MTKREWKAKFKAKQKQRKYEKWLRGHQATINEVAALTERKVQ